jgi:hypothetical protein
MSSDIVAVGFRAKTGRAIAVVLGGTAREPRAIRRTEVLLSDPRRDPTCQPYHLVMDLPFAEWSAAVSPAAAAIEKIARESMKQLFDELAASNLTVRRIGVVGSPDRDLSTIGGAHVRAHASEGILFRAVLERAAEHLDVSSRTLREQELASITGRELRLSAKELKTRLGEFGRALGTPWRTDQKSAALAAWLSLPRAN